MRFDEILNESAINSILFEEVIIDFIKDKPSFCVTDTVLASNLSGYGYENLLYTLRNLIDKGVIGVLPLEDGKNTIYLKII